MIPSITRFVLGDFQTNCYIVRDPGQNACWIVDCGQRPDELLDYISTEGLQPVAILLTHAHADHIWGIDQALSRLGDLPIFLHEAEQDWCGNPMLNLSELFGFPVSVTGPTDLLKHDDTLKLASSTWRVIHTPGHSPGSVCFVHDDSDQAIVGDTLFAGSIGRIDFPTSDPEAMKRSLHDQLLKLPDSMAIYPGHLEPTTIGQERTTNPYLTGIWS